MSKTSCVQPPENDRFAVVRNSYVLFCEGNHCAAALLNFFQFQYDRRVESSEESKRKNDIAETHGDRRTQDEGLWIFETADDLEIGLVGLFKREKIADAIALLQTRGVIQVGSNPNPKYHFDKTKWFLFHPEVLKTWMKDCYPDARKQQITAMKKLTEERKEARKSSKQTRHSDIRLSDNAVTENKQQLPENREQSSENGNSSYKAFDSSFDSAFDSKAEEPSEETVNQPQDQKQEQNNAEPLPTETAGDCAAPPIGGLRDDSERQEPSVDSPGVGEDFPSWKRYVMAHYGTRDEHAVTKHLRAADRVSELTGEKVVAWCARFGTLQEWLNRNVDGTYFGKTNGRGHSNGFSGNGHSPKSAEVKRLESPATVISDATLSLMTAIALVTYKNIAMKPHADLCQAAAVELAKVGATCEIVTGKFGNGSWWYQKDWRGQRGSCPTPAQLVEVWGQWENTNGNGANGTTHAISRNGFIPGRPCQWKGDDGDGTPKPVRTSKRTYPV